MNLCKSFVPPNQEAKLCAYDRWYQALGDYSLRRDCPNAYHDELLKLADEMDRQGFVTWREWHELRIEADQAYLQAVAGADYHQ